MFERPRHHGVGPGEGAKWSRSSIRQPRGVQGTMDFWPVARRPTLRDVKAVGRPFRIDGVDDEIGNRCAPEAVIAQGWPCHFRVPVEPFDQRREGPPRGCRRAACARSSSCPASRVWRPFRAHVDLASRRSSAHEAPRRGPGEALPLPSDGANIRWADPRARMVAAKSLSV